MNTQDRNPERQDRKRQLDKLTEEDLTKSERDLSPETNKHRPFPESPISKDQRKETEDVQRESEDLEQLADDVEGTVGSRQTGSNPDDIAGVADLDHGLRSRRRRKG